MKKGDPDELRSEYKRSDLGRGVRGKYVKAYQSGTNLVLLKDDVAEVFPDEESVNEAKDPSGELAPATERISLRLPSPLRGPSLRSG